MDPIIEIQQLSFCYPDGKQALAEIDLMVLPGERVALVGANGAGKSTLLMHLNGILTGDGTIQIRGMEVKKKNLGDIRALVGVVFQNPDDQLFSPSVYDDVAFGPIHQGFDKQTVRKKVEQSLNAVGMGGFADRNPSHLSSGEKKRVAIAAVLSMQPEILVFDEPSAGLDPRARRELIGLLKGLPQTMLIATHDLQLAAELAPRTVILEAGRIVADGETSAILTDLALLEKHGLW